MQNPLVTESVLEPPLTQKLSTRPSCVDSRVTSSRFISVNFSCVRGPRVDLGSPRGDTFSTTGFSPGRNPRFLTHTRIVQADDCSPGLCR